ncbi:nucleotidyl transferase AbiEii/AbiGii toxin family protein [candidate division WOR-3 bacterium]|nr:nucleotidyl transferase AbiEii/AbiGii toxin family protein [candidate division WOR-3 bacterium]
MLTREELFKQAEARGVPAARARGIVREYVHYLILHGINSYTDRLIFTGGTALRLIHNFGRLSFDLDFDASGMTKDEFAEILRRVRTDMVKLGFDVKSGPLKHRQNILTAEIRLPDAFRLYGIDTAQEQLMVKIEVLNVPEYRLKSNFQLVRNFDGQTILVNVLALACLAAEKIAAFFERARERDYYDVLFLTLNKAPVDLDMLNRIVGKGTFTDHSDLLVRVKSKFERANMDQISKKLEPFLIIPGHLNVLKNGARLLSELI